MLMQFQKDGEVGFKHAIYLLSTKLFLRSLRLFRPASPSKLDDTPPASYHNLFEECTLLPTIKKEPD